MVFAPGLGLRVSADRKEGVSRPLPARGQGPSRAAWAVVHRLAAASTNTRRVPHHEHSALNRLGAQQTGTVVGVVEEIGAGSRTSSPTPCPRHRHERGTPRLPRPAALRRLARGDARVTRPGHSRRGDAPRAMKVRGGRGGHPRDYSVLSWAALAGASTASAGFATGPSSPWACSPWPCSSWACSSSQCSS